MFSLSCGSPKKGYDAAFAYNLYAFARNPWAIGAGVFLAPLMLQLGAPDSFFSYAVSITSVIIGFLLPIAGALADLSMHRKKFLTTFAMIGCLSTAIVLFMWPSTWWLSGILLILTLSSYECALIMSYVDMLFIKEWCRYAYMPDVCTTQDELDSLSAQGVVWGNAGMIFAVVVLGGVSYVYDTVWGLRFCVLATGIWWGGWTLFSLRYIPPPTPQLDNIQEEEIKLFSGFSRVRDTLQKVRGNKEVMLCLILYLFFVDGSACLIANLSTLYTVAAQAAPSDLALIVVCAHVCGIASALGAAKLAKQWSTKVVCCISLGLWMVITPPLAFLSPDNLYRLGIPLGCCLGSVFAVSNALTRSWFASFLLPGQEAEYFGFFEFCGLCTAWTSTLLWAVITSKMGIQSAVLSVMLYFIPAFVVSLFVPREKSEEKQKLLE